MRERLFGLFLVVVLGVPFPSLASFPWEPVQYPGWEDGAPHSTWCPPLDDPARVWEIQEHVTYLENEYVKIGVGHAYGGAIYHVGEAGTNRNLVNAPGMGRQIQLAYFTLENLPATVCLDGVLQQRPTWHNPTQAGSECNWSSQLLDARFEGSAYYVKARAELFSELTYGDKIQDCACTPAHLSEIIMESWTELIGRAVRVRYRLSHTGRTRYYQGLLQAPAAFLVSSPQIFSRIVTYSGSHPWRWDGVSTELQVQRDGTETVSPPLQTEGWMAAVDDYDYGLTVFNRKFASFDGYYQQYLDWDTDLSDPCNNSSMGLLTNDTFTLPPGGSLQGEYYLFLGPLQEARAFIYQLHGTDISEGFSDDFLPPSNKWRAEHGTWSAGRGILTGQSAKKTGIHGTYNLFGEIDGDRNFHGQYFEGNYSFEAVMRYVAAVKDRSQAPPSYGIVFRSASGDIMGHFDVYSKLNYELRVEPRTRNRVMVRLIRCGDFDPIAWKVETTVLGEAIVQVAAKRFNRFRVDVSGTDSSQFNVYVNDRLVFTAHDPDLFTTGGYFFLTAKHSKFQVDRISIAPLP